MSEFTDIIIVGAGLSGIGTAVHLQQKCPQKEYIILEGRDSIGGTWDLFRYPGIRSDSDMHTLGYNFKPWEAAEAIADGPAILSYIKETATEYNVQQHIRFGHMVKHVAWSSEDAAWTVECERKNGERVSLRCNMLLFCAGYYSYKAGYTPEFKGVDRFQGNIIHPQKWPKELDYSGKKVVVIGSGATAVTLVPAMTDKAAHVTMLQRSPTYIVSQPQKDVIANFLRRVLPDQTAYNITRWKNVTLQQYFYNWMRRKPEKSKQRLIDMIRQALGDEYDVDTHFTPRYNPWDQRLCLVPDGDLFEAIKAKKASIVTDQIDSFTENGLLLQSGKTLDADIIVTATGLVLEPLGGTTCTMDGAPVDFADTFTYKGMMFSSIPNLILTFGYINASWTLRSDLTAEYTCRLLNHMDEIGANVVTAQLREEDEGMAKRPFIENFSSGYMQRAMHLLPKQGDKEPWINPQNYRRDKKMMRHGKIDDGVLQFETSAVGAQHAAPLPLQTKSVVD